MAELNPSIILAGQQPNFLRTLGEAAVTAGNTNNVMQQNALRGFLRDNGAAVMAGDKNALGQYAGFDPQAALGIQETRQAMRIREEQIQMARAAAARAAAGVKDKAALERELAQGIKGLQMAGAALQANGGQGDPQAWGMILREFNLPNIPMTPDGFALIAAGVKGIDDGLRSTFIDAVTPASPSYKTENGYYFDQNNPGAGAKPIPGIPASGGSEAEREIARVMELGATRQQAIAVKEGILTVVTNEVTKEPFLVNKITKEVFPLRSEVQNQQPESQPSPSLSFGTQFQNATPAFGAEGAARKLVNRISDVLTGTVPFPETLEAQKDFELFGESLVNGFASAYGRQPPSWLLKNIADLTPKPGSIFEGPQEAKTKLEAMVREMETRRSALVRTSSGRQMDPKTRVDIEGQILGIDAVLTQLQAAIGGFAPSGVDPSDVDLMQRLLSE